MRSNTPEIVYGRGVRDDNGCLRWPEGMARTHNGYGLVGYHGKQWRVHVWSFVQTYGPVPRGLVVCHACDVPDCYEPEHLFAGTQRANVQDCIRKGRRRTGTYERTPEHRAELRRQRMAATDTKYGHGQPVQRVGDPTELPQRVPPSIPAGTPLLQRTCTVCGADFLAPAALAQRYSTCSKECSSLRRQGVHQAPAGVRTWTASTTAAAAARMA